MTTSEEKPDKLDDEIARVAEAYFQDRKAAVAGSIESYLEKHPHLGEELRQALEGIDLLSVTVTDRLPTAVGDYQIHLELGRGGMGTVYLATQTSLKRKVALKVLKTFSNDTAVAVDRFQREAQTIASLRHESIVPIFDSGEVDGLRYFAMQWVEGDSVAQLISKGAGMTLTRADERARVIRIAQWGSQIAEALDYAHQQGIVHRDIKPSNLLVDRDQRIWLTDFGLAYDKGGELACTGTYQGTPNYMSPEQASAIAAPIDHRSDIYSLAVTLVEWLTGQSVVGGSNPVESLSRLQLNSVEGLGKQLRHYGRDWISVLEKCTAREPKDRYSSAAELSADLRAIANHRPVQARKQLAVIRHLRNLVTEKNVLRTCLISVVVTVATLLIGTAAWKAYANSKLHRVIIASNSGDWLSVTARDKFGNKVAEFTAAEKEVFLPSNEVSLDVIASQRLGYRQKITPASTVMFNNAKTILLESPQSHRWMLDDVLWYLNRDIERLGKSSNVCIALVNDGIALLETQSGKTLWKFENTDNVQWGNSIRGCPSSFQPDRCCIVRDTNNNQCDEIIFSHPEKPELICLDSEDGKQLWRSNLIDPADIKTPITGTLCPVVLQEFAVEDLEVQKLSVVVAANDISLAAANRWLACVDTTSGKVDWKVASQQTAKTATTPIATRPLHVQWGEVEKRPLDFGWYNSMGGYFDDYWRSYISTNSPNPFDTNVRLGSERPFALSVEKNQHWHWIDGPEWHVIDHRTGELVKAWQLQDDCVCSPKLIRTDDRRTLVLTAHQRIGTTTDFMAWDLETYKPMWQQTMECDLNRLPQSYLSPPQDFPIVADLDEDGVDEWIAASCLRGTRWSQPMTPPFGMLMAHRSSDGSAVWKEPFHLPNLDSMVERGVVIKDLDGDGWKDLLLGSRFHGGGVRDGVACFVDLISGKTGRRIWHSNVRTESSKSALEPNELVDLIVSEAQGLIAVVTHRGMNAYNLESPRPYSTTFLNLENGREQTFGLGIRANSLSDNVWLEHRLPATDSLIRVNRPQPGQLAGWAYPVVEKDSLESLVLWNTEDYSAMLCEDLDRDGFPEVVGAQNQVENREYVLLDGITGNKRWRKKVTSQHSSNWFELAMDVDRDKIDDLVVLTSGVDSQGQFATVEMVSGATGRAIWQHSAIERGTATVLGYFKRDTGQLPLLIYQNGINNKVTCIDLDSRKVAWSNDSFEAVLEPQAFGTWLYDGKIVWFSMGQTEQGNSAHFVNAETGETLLQIPIGPQPSIPWSNWIRWGGRELLPIQTVTRILSNVAGQTSEFQTDLWLIDRSVEIVGHWSETTKGASSTVAANWFQKSNYDLPFPTIAKTPDGKELLSIPACIDGSIGIRLLGWDDHEPKKMKVDRTIRLPIDPSSASATVAVLDCDGDEVSDFVTLSNGGLDCISGGGEPLWHRPPMSPESRLCQPSESEGHKYLCLQTADANSMLFVDARNGEVSDGSQTDPMKNALNRDRLDHASFITLVSDARNSSLTAIRKKGTTAREAVDAKVDPRYVRLLPWVVNAKFFLLSNEALPQSISWTRIVKLAAGVFLVPLVVGWSCLRTRLTIRRLFLVATTIAVALALEVADAREFPTGQSADGYIIALGAAGLLAAHLILFALPIVELARARWRRRLSIGLYIAFVLIIPVFTLLTNPVGAIPTTYTYQEFWHLFWFALLPTGAMLRLIHSLRLLGAGAIRLSKGNWRRFRSLWPIKVAPLHGTGESHGG